MSKADMKSLSLDPWEPFVQQRVFRILMKCFAFPGSIEPIRENNTVGGTVLQMLLATLVDEEVGVADIHQLISESDWLKLETLRDIPEKAQFIISLGDLEPVFEPCTGTLENPELGATLVVRVKSLSAGRRLSVSGPGVQGSRQFALSGLNPLWMQQRDEWNSSFPMGVDMVLFDSTHVAALPRTSRVQIMEND